MLGHHMIEAYQIAAAPERATLGILLVVLHTVEQALYIEHPTLLHEDLIKPGRPRTLSLAGKIIDRCDKLGILIEKYDEAVEEALGNYPNYSDEIPF